MLFPTCPVYQPSLPPLLPLSYSQFRLFCRPVLYFPLAEPCSYSWSRAFSRCYSLHYLPRSFITLKFLLAALPRLPFVFFFFFFFSSGDRVLLCSPGWPGTCHVVHAGHTSWSSSLHSPSVRLKVFTVMPSYHLYFIPRSWFRFCIFLLRDCR
jgi:hypothetical protein